MNSFIKYQSPIGPLLLMSDGVHLTGLYMQTSRHSQPLSGWVEDSEAEPLAATVLQLGEYFAGARRSFDLPLRLAGTPFQQRVWQELTEIPFGETWSYGQLARRIGNPNASRAVGLANGRNPISILVPCHRVIGANGTLTGYGGGLERKEWLLAHEGIPSSLHQRQGHREHGAAAIGSIGGESSAAVEFRNQPHNIQAQTEMRLVVAVPALLKERLE
jgi:methylated-DNA-[protein]-cysteine S-methyltransferase